MQLDTDDIKVFKCLVRPTSEVRPLLHEYINSSILQSERNFAAFSSTRSSMPISTGNLYGSLVIFIALCSAPVFATINGTELQNHTMVTKRYPLMNVHLEEEGIYTSVQ